MALIRYRTFFRKSFSSPCVLTRHAHCRCTRLPPLPSAINSEKPVDVTTSFTFWPPRSSVTSQPWFSRVSFVNAWAALCIISLHSQKSVFVDSRHCPTSVPSYHAIVICNSFNWSVFLSICFKLQLHVMCCFTNQSTALQSMQVLSRSVLCLYYITSKERTAYNAVFQGNVNSLPDLWARKWPHYIAVHLQACHEVVILCEFQFRATIEMTILKEDQGFTVAFSGFYFVICVTMQHKRSYACMALKVSHRIGTCLVTEALVFSAGVVHPRHIGLHGRPSLLINLTWKLCN